MTNVMRVASLLPAATEWIAAFGASKMLCARSHECNYPSEIELVPVVTTSGIDSDTSSTEIDEQVRRHLDEGLSLYGVDTERLRALSPDLVVTQAQCDVCAVTEKQLSDALSAAVDSEAELLSLSPSTFKEVLDGALKLARKIGREKTAMAWIAEREQHLRQLRSRLAPLEPASVVAIEWMDPLMTAGHWTPDLIEHAGGISLLAEAGAASTYIGWDDLLSADPDVVCIIPCGFDLGQIRENLDDLTGRSEWRQLRAVQEGEVYAFDGDAYFNRPGPRLYRSIELMAYALHGEKVKGAIRPPAADEMARVRFSQTPAS